MGDNFYKYVMASFLKSGPTLKGRNWLLEEQRKEFAFRGAYSFPLRVTPHWKRRQTCKVESLDKLPIQFKH